MEEKKKRDRKAYYRQWYEKNRQSEIARATRRAKEGRAKRRAIVDEYKLQHGCNRCGYNKCASAIDAHHARNDKEYGISAMIKKLMPIDKIMQEIAKCELVCANCHREEHDARWITAR